MWNAHGSLQQRNRRGVREHGDRTQVDGGADRLRNG